MNIKRERGKGKSGKYFRTILRQLQNMHGCIKGLVACFLASSLVVYTLSFLLPIVEWWWYDGKINTKRRKSCEKVSHFYYNSVMTTQAQVSFSCNMNKHKSKYTAAAAASRNLYEFSFRTVAERKKKLIFKNIKSLSCYRDKMFIHPELWHLTSQSKRVENNGFVRVYSNAFQNIMLCGTLPWYQTNTHTLICIYTITREIKVNVNI